MSTTSTVPGDDAPSDAGSADRTILVVDDHRSFAEMLSAALDTVEGLICVAIAGTAAEGIALAARLRPSIVIMDIQMPGKDGLVATRRIREVAPDTLIAVVTAYRDQHWISRAAQAGASAFIPKNGSLEELLDVLRRIAHGQLIVASSAYKGRPAPTPQSSIESTPALTPRELEVLSYLGKGMPAQGIARVLGITLHTCRGHLKSVYAKLGVNTQLEAVLKARNLGLIDS